MTATDLVVVLPGILGSSLRRHDGRLVWAPSAGAVLRAIATFGRSIQRLQLPEGIGDDHPGDGIQPAGLMPDLHLLPGIWTPIKGYDRLLARLGSLGYHRGADHSAPPGNLLPVGYDWRLSNRWTGRWLAGVVEPALDRWRAQGGPYRDARLIFVCHSMGGLVARWYIEWCGGADLTDKLITVGTPYRGAAKALAQLVNGVPSGLGQLAVDLTGFARSLPAAHQLLPEYACIAHDGELVKTTETALPELATAAVVDAMRFHTQLHDAETKRPASLATTYPIVGIQQPTPTTIRLRGGHALAVDSYRHEELFGDATVPIVAACRADVAMTSNMLRRVSDKHGNLHRSTAALDEIEGILTAKNIVVRAPDTVDLQVAAPELAFAGQDIPVQVTPADGSRQALRVTVTAETGHLVDSRLLPPRGGTTCTVLDGLPPGGYTLDVGGLDATSPLAPVSSTVLVWSEQPAAAHADEPGR